MKLGHITKFKEVLYIDLTKNVDKTNLAPTPISVPWSSSINLSFRAITKDEKIDMLDLYKHLSSEIGDN